METTVNINDIETNQFIFQNGDNIVIYFETLRGKD